MWVHLMKSKRLLRVRKMEECKTMNEEIIKPGLVKRTVDNLDDKKIVIGGNKELYKRRYHLQYTQEIVDNVLSALLQTMEEIIEEGNSIRLNGYMTIQPTYYNSRMARNVYENTEIKIPARYKLKFKAGTKLVEACKRFNDKEDMDDENGAKK